MIDLSDKYLLMIEPTELHAHPVNDHWTLWTTTLLNKVTIGTRWRGSHGCSCGETSGSCDLILPNGMITNSLAVHYIQMHRFQVPRSEFDKIEALIHADGIYLTRERLEKLLSTERKMAALEAGGVANWDLYNESLKKFWRYEGFLNVAPKATKIDLTQSRELTEAQVESLDKASARAPAKVKVQDLPSRNIGVS